MRSSKYKCSLKTQITPKPWSQPPTDPQMQQQLSDLLIYHPIQNDYLPPTHERTQDSVTQTVNKPQVSQQFEKPGRTLTVIKKYCEKFYTEPYQLFSQKAQHNKNRLTPNRGKTELTYKYPLSTQNLKVVDITNSFQEKEKQVPVKSNRPKSASKMLKIQSEMRKYRQSLKDRSYVESNKQMHPHTRSVTLQRLSVSPSPKRRVVYPLQNFSQLLHEFLISN